MNDTLKAAGRIGAELGAAKAEIQTLRTALLAIDQRNDNPARFDQEIDKIVRNALSQQSDHVRDAAQMMVPSEILKAIAWGDRDDAAEAIGSLRCLLADPEGEDEIAFPDSPEPTDTFTAVDMATAAAQGFRDGQAAVEQAPAEDEHQPVGWHTDDHLTDKSATTYDREVADRWRGKGWPVYELYARPAQTEQQPVAAPKCATCNGFGKELSVYEGGIPCRSCKSDPTPAQDGRDLPDHLNDAIDNLVHDNYERSQAGSRNRQADADLIRAALAARPAQTEQQPAYVECRECTDCGHVGINDAHQTDATCAMCDWSGPSPVEDQCPDCGKENVMGAACPKCSGRYRILAETHVAAPIAQTAPQGKFRMGDIVKKSTGSEWEGRVVGWYSTEQTKEGYAVESEAHAGSVQIYPAKALEAVE